MQLALDIKDNQTSLYKQGRIEGKLEGKLELARKLLKEGVKPEVIAKAAGLTLAEVEKLIS
jgi:predicted transposase/invertase (TIGR01784 family)